MVWLLCVAYQVWRLRCKTVSDLESHHIGYWLQRRHPIAICVSQWTYLNLLTFSFGPDGRYPTLSEFYHRGIRAPPCTASIGTWTDGRRSEDHSRHEFRCDVSDIDLALVKAMRLYRMIYIYIFVFQFPRAFWLQCNCLPYHLTWHPLDSPTKSAENRNSSPFEQLDVTPKSSRDVRRIHRMRTPK